MTRGPSAEVRFRAVVDAPDFSHPSRLIADFVRPQLITYRVRCLALRDVAAGAAFACVVGERAFEIEVQGSTDRDHEWRMLIWSKLGRIRRVLRAKDDRELLHLRRALDKILSGATTIDGITWDGDEQEDESPDGEADRPAEAA